VTLARELLVGDRFFVFDSHGPKTPLSSTQLMVIVFRCSELMNGELLGIIWSLLAKTRREHREKARIS
jgi:hypothetical protein